MAVEDKFNINLNQNLWGLVVAFAALGMAEYWCLKWLFRLSLTVAIVMSISVFFTILFYTERYSFTSRRAVLSLE